MCPEIFSEETPCVSDSSLYRRFVCLPFTGFVLIKDMLSYSFQGCIQSLDTSVLTFPSICAIPLTWIGQRFLPLQVGTSYMIPIVYRNVYWEIDSYIVPRCLSYLCVLGCLTVLAYFSYLACLSVLAYLCVLAYFSYLACLRYLAYFCVLGCLRVLAYFSYLAFFRYSLSEITSGVPQGSILGPLFFVIFINDFLDVVCSDNTIVLYADDSKMFRVIDCDEDLIYFQEDLDKLHHWSQRNQMALNTNSRRSWESLGNKYPLLTVCKWMIPFLRR